MITFETGVPHMTLMRTYKAIDVFVIKCQQNESRQLLGLNLIKHVTCLLYTSPSPRDGLLSRMPSSA